MCQCVSGIISQSVCSRPCSCNITWNQTCRCWCATASSTTTMVNTTADVLGKYLLAVTQVVPYKRCVLCPPLCLCGIHCTFLCHKQWTFLSSQPVRLDWSSGMRYRLIVDLRTRKADLSVLTYIQSDLFRSLPISSDLLYSAVRAVKSFSIFSIKSGVFFVYKFWWTSLRLWILQCAVHGHPVSRL